MIDRNSKEKLGKMNNNKNNTKDDAEDKDQDVMFSYDGWIHIKKN